VIIEELPMLGARTTLIALLIGSGAIAGIVSIISEPAPVKSNLSDVPGINSQEYLDRYSPDAVSTAYDYTKVGLPRDFKERLAEFFRRWPAHCNTGTYGEQHRCAGPVALELGLDPDLIMRAGLGKWDPVMRHCRDRHAPHNEPVPWTKECAYSTAASSVPLGASK
jgi:hypothetical protein